MACSAICFWAAYDKSNHRIRISPGAGQIILTNLRYKPHINKRVLAGHERSPPWTKTQQTKLSKSFLTPRGSCRSDVFDPKDRQMQRPRVPNGRTK